MGFSLCALTGLLVSPVSWTHHWTLAVPALLLLGVRVVRERSRVGIAAFAAVMLLGYSYLPKLMTKPALTPNGAFPAWWTLASASYVLIGLTALAVAGAYETRRAGAALSNRRSASRRRLAVPAITPHLRGA